MKVKPLKFQEGGPAPAPAAPAPAPEGGAAPVEGGEQNPLIQIAQMAMQALQTGDCEIAMQVCEAFIQLVQASAGGGAPEEAPQGEPVYKKGGTLVRRIKK